jgi:excisionase family DNA binding protein
MRPNVPTLRTSPRNPPEPARSPLTLAALVAERLAPPSGDRPRAPPQLGTPGADAECVTADELAVWLGVNRKTVYEYAARGVIPCRRLGRRLVFSRPAIRAWLARSSGSDPAPFPAVSSRRRR